MTGREREPHGPALDIASTAFEKAEHWITVGIGAILACAALLLLTGSLVEVWQSLKQWPKTDGIFLIVDKMLFVLMLVEILHTVRASIQSKQLAVEPFLTVGLIAAVRRMLIVTIEASATTTGETAPKEPFDHAMIELGVLAGLIIVLIVSIYLSRRSEREMSPER